MRENESGLFTQFSSLVRINETASKDLILCYAVYDSTDFCVDSVQSLSKISILETLINRWVPEENRDNQTDQHCTSTKEFDD